MFLEPVKAPEELEYKWEDHSGNEYFTLQAKDAKRNQSFFNPFKLNPLFSEKPEYKFRIIINSPEPDIWVVAVNYTLDQIRFEWSILNDLIIPEISGKDLESIKNLMSEYIYILNNNVREGTKEPHERGHYDIIIESFPYIDYLKITMNFGCIYSDSESKKYDVDVCITPKVIFVISKKKNSTKLLSAIPFHIIKSIAFIKYGKIGIYMKIIIGCNSQTYTLSDIPNDNRVLGILYLLSDLNVRIYMKQIDDLSSSVNTMVAKDIMIGDLSEKEYGDTYIATPIIPNPFRSQLLNTSRSDIHQKKSSSYTDFVKFKRSSKSDTQIKYTADSFASEEYIIEKCYLYQDIEQRATNIQFCNYFTLTYDERIFFKANCYYHDNASRMSRVGMVYISDNFVCFGEFQIVADKPLTPNKTSNDRPELQSFLLSRNFTKVNSGNIFTFCISRSKISTIKTVGNSLSRILDFVELLSSSGVLSLELSNGNDLMFSFLSKKDKNNFYRKLMIHNKGSSMGVNKIPEKTSSTVTLAFSDKEKHSSKSLFRDKDTSSSKDMDLGTGFRMFPILSKLDTLSMNEMEGLNVLSNENRNPENLACKNEANKNADIFIKYSDTSLKNSISVLREPLSNIFPSGSSSKEILSNEPASFSASGNFSCENVSSKLNKGWVDYFKIYSDDSISIKNYELLRSLIFLTRGVPNKFKKKFWGLCIGPSYEKSLKGVYREILIKNIGKSNEYEESIRKDVGRSMPEHPAFRSEVGIDALNRVLMAYSWRNPRVGYAQSFNIICAQLLLEYPEEKAFMTLCFIVERLLPDNYSKTMLGSIVDQYILTELVENLYPNLRTHILSMSIDIPALSISWFICIFQNTVSDRISTAFMDAFLLDGHIFLFWVSLAIFEINQKQILNECSKEEDPVERFKSFFARLDTYHAMDPHDRSGLDNFQKLMKLAYTKYPSIINNDLIASLRMKYRLLVSDSIKTSTLRFYTKNVFDNMGFNSDEVHILLRISTYINHILEGTSKNYVQILNKKCIREIDETITLGFWGLNSPNKDTKCAIYRTINTCKSSFFCIFDENQVQQDQIITYYSYRNILQVLNPWGVPYVGKADDYEENWRHKLDSCLHAFQQKNKGKELGINFIPYFDRIYYYSILRSALVSLAGSRYENTDDLLRKNFVSANNRNNSLQNPAVDLSITIAMLLGAFDMIMKETVVNRMLFFFKLYDINGDGFLNIFELFELCIGLMDAVGMYDGRACCILSEKSKLDMNEKQNTILLNSIKRLFHSAAKISNNNDELMDSLIAHQILVKGNRNFINKYLKMICQLLYSGNKDSVFLIRDIKETSKIAKEVDVIMGNHEKKVKQVDFDDEITNIAANSLFRLGLARESLSLSFEDFWVHLSSQEPLIKFFQKKWMWISQDDPISAGEGVKLVEIE